MSYRIMHFDRKKISLMINFIDIEKLTVDYLLSSSDSSDEELLLYTHLMRKKKIPNETLYYKCCRSVYCRRCKYILEIFIKSNIIY